MAWLLAALVIPCAARADRLADPFTGQWNASIDSNRPPDGEVSLSRIPSATGSASVQRMGGRPCAGATTYYRGDYTLPARPGSSFVYTGSMYGCTSRSSHGHVQMDGRFQDARHTGRFRIAVCVDVTPSENRFVGGWYFATGASASFYGIFRGTRAGTCGGPGARRGGGGGGGGEGATFAGRWATDFGTMKLTQSGHQVTGAYAYCNGTATITGIVHGGVLDGNWSQPCNSRSGRLRFVLGQTGQTFKGLWSYGSAVPSRPWEGRRA